MPFEVIPAIDLSQGRLARFTREGPAPVDAFGGDPLAAAESFVEAGARRIHVVDLDLAFSGEARNLDAIAAVAGLAVSVQASGGVATPDEVEAMLGAGATRVVLGSAALNDRPLVESLIASLGERLIIGLEVGDDRIRARGRSARELPLEETLAWLSGSGARRYLMTEIDRVGTLAGAGLDHVRAIASALKAPVLVSGGVASPDDVRALIGLGTPVEGAVVGRALVEGELSLPALLRVAAESPLESP